MKIILNNGVELYPLVVNGNKEDVLGAKRDVLSFVFSSDENIFELDTVFSESACERIVIVGDNNQKYIYDGYTIRVRLNKAPVTIKNSDCNKPAKIEERITVAMGQRTYIESQLQALGINI